MRYLQQVAGTPNSEADRSLVFTLKAASCNIKYMWNNSKNQSIRFVDGEVVDEDLYKLPVYQRQKATKLDVLENAY